VLLATADRPQLVITEGTGPGRGVVIVPCRSVLGFMLLRMEGTRRAASRSGSMARALAAADLTVTMTMLPGVGHVGLDTAAGLVVEEVMQFLGKDSL
jgi:hypothetical protein